MFMYSYGFLQGKKVRSVHKIIIEILQFFIIAPFTLVIRNATRLRFDDEPASVVAGTPTLHGGRGGSTAVLFFSLFYLFTLSKNPRSTTEDT